MKMPSVGSIYNPAIMSREELIDRFVVRHKKFRSLYREIKDSKMEVPEQHLLIEAQRGMGKTTMLLRLAYEIERDEALHAWLIPVIFNEESYGITRLFKLWERVAEYLEEKGRVFNGLYDEMDTAYEQYENDQLYERAAFKMLINRLQQAEKKIILFIDNLDDILHKFKKQERQRLREVLMTCPELRIFGATSKLSDAFIPTDSIFPNQVADTYASPQEQRKATEVREPFFDYSEPLYEFFKIVRLRPLNQKETEDLLLKLGETYKQEAIEYIVENQKGRVETMRRLTGGIIRTLVMLFEIFVDNKKGSAFKDLEGILDRITPLYKHRMDDLPPQKQEIVEAVALNWDAMSVKEIAQRTRLESKKVSAQLKELVRHGMIEKRETHTKNHLYAIQERFFNIWYLMRNGRKNDRNKVIWLVRFFEDWLDETTYEKRVNRFLENLKTGDYSISGAYYMAETLSGVRHAKREIQHNLLKATKDFLTKNKSELANSLSASDKDLWDASNLLCKSEEYEKVIQQLKQVRVPNEDVFFRIAYCYHELEKHESAEQYYLKAIEKDHVDAMYNLGLLYQNEERYNSAEIYYLKAIEKEDIDALNNLANVYKDQKRYDLAEEYYLKAIKKGEINALNNLACLYDDQKRYDLAEKYYLKAIEKGDISAMNNIAILYDNQEHYDLAEKYYLKAIEKEHVDAMNNLGILYDNQKRYDLAEKYYLKAIEKEDIDAMNSLAWLYFTQKNNKEKAFELSVDLLKQDISFYEWHTCACIFLWNNDVEKAKQASINFITKEYIEEDTEAITQFFSLLLAKNQADYLYKLFHSEKGKALKLKDRFRPSYYAMMYHLREKYPNEYLKMGSELKETVEEMLEQIEQMRVDYK
ncbi:MAG: tetratricopeptide repeat protein [Bacteroidota bacterium]